MMEVGFSCPWEPIHGFVSPSEFKRFSDWVLTQIATGEATCTDRPAADRHVASSGTRYLKHVGSGQVWRIDEPDGPFRGSFCPVVPG